MKYNIIDQGILALVHHLHSPILREWDVIRNKAEYEYRKNIPEGKVVDSLKAWIDGQWAPPEEHARLWQEVLKAIKELDEGEETRIKVLQEFQDNKRKGVC